MSPVGVAEAVPNGGVPEGVFGDLFFGSAKANHALSATDFDITDTLNTGHQKTFVGAASSEQIDNQLNCGDYHSSGILNSIVVECEGPTDSAPHLVGGLVDLAGPLDTHPPAGLVVYMACSFEKGLVADQEGSMTCENQGPLRPDGVILNVGNECRY